MHARPVHPSLCLAARLVPWAVALCALAPPQSAGAGPGIQGPTVLAPGERAVYRVTVAGDPARDACDASVAIDVPRGFRVLRSFPAAATTEARSGGLRFAPIPTLRRGDEALFEIELEAPRAAAAGSLCARLDYGPCPKPRARDLEVGPVCASLSVIQADARSTASAPRARALNSLRVIPCGAPPRVQPGGGTFDPNEWTDAAADSLSTVPAATLLAKTSGDQLYLALRVADTAYAASDSVEVFVDVNAGTGPPDAADRAYLAPRGGAGGTRFSGSGGFTTSLGAFNLFEVAEVPGVEYVVEMQVALADLGGPVDPTQAIRIAAEIRDGGLGSPWPAGFDRLDQETMYRSDLNFCVAGECTFTTWAQAPDPLDPRTAANPELLYDDIAGPNATYAGSSFSGGQELRPTSFSNGGSTGNVLRVELLVHFYVDAAVSNDSLDVDVFFGGTRIVNSNISNGQLNTFLNSPGTFVQDVTGARAWTVADFDPAVDLDVVLLPRRNGSWDGVGLLIDAVGFRVRTDGTCTSPASGPGPDVFVSKDDGFATVLKGQYLTYQLSFGNQGGATATNVEIVDQIPPNTTYHRGGTGLLCPTEATCQVLYSATGVAWTTIEPAEGANPLWIKFTLSLLAPAGPARYAAAYQVRVDPFANDGDKVENQAVISLSQVDEVPANNSDWDDGAAPDSGDEVGPFVFPSISIPCDFRRPTIDGIVDVANEYPLPTPIVSFRAGNSETVSVYVQHDATDLYIAFDVDDAQLNNRDACFVVIDSNNNKLYPDSDDRQYERDRGNSDQFFVGVGSNSDSNHWQNSVTLGAQTARGERPGGWQAEYRIPFTDLPNISGQGEVIGIAFLNFSTSCGSCWANHPAFAQLDLASSWTNAYLEPCSPNPDFTWVTACAGQAVAFTDTTTNGPTTWAWDFGDGSPAESVQNPTHVYAAGGFYNVTLTSCNASGCRSVTKAVEVWALPAAALNAEAARCLYGTQAIPLDASSSQPGAGATIASFVWTTTLGSVTGSSGPGETLTATAADNGTAAVTVTVTDSHSCSASASVNIALNAPPLPALAARPSGQCFNPAATAAVNLDASATSFPSGAQDQWNWSLPPGHGLAGSGPVVDWAIPPGSGPGTYTASLQVVASNSCAATISADATLWRLPAVSVAASPARMCAVKTGTLPVALSATTSDGDAPVDPNGFTWSNTAGHPLGGSTTASETATVPALWSGSFDACAAARDGNACGASACTTVIVDALPVPDFTAAFPRNCTDDVNDILVPLDASATTPLASIPDPAGFLWSVTAPATLQRPDGRTNTLRIPAGFAGNLTVTLTVQDGLGCSDSVAKTFTVLAGPTPAFEPPPFERCTDLVQDNIVDLDGSASGPNVDPTSGLAWDTSLGPGVLTSTTGPTTRLVLAPGFVGTIQVRLTVTDRDGCSRAIARDYTFLARPQIVLRPSATASCFDPVSQAPFTLDASASSSPNGLTGPAAFAWTSSLGTGVFDAFDRPVVTLTPPTGFSGTIGVTLTVTDDKGCDRVENLDLVVHPGPAVVASVNPPRQCGARGGPVVFGLDATGTASPDGIRQLAWSTTEPQATVASTGPFRADLTLPVGFAGVVPLQLHVEDNAGCAVDASYFATVDPLPAVRMAVTPLEACDADGQGARFQLDARGSTLPSAVGPGGYIWSSVPAATIVPDAVEPRLATLLAPVGFTGPLVVTFEIVDVFGCRDAATAAVEVKASPIAVLDVATTSLCSPASDARIDLDATGSTSGSPIADPGGFAWTVTPPPASLARGDGGRNVLIVPAGFAGAVDVGVTVTDALGCSARRQVTVDVWALPEPVIQESYPACAPPGPIDIALDASASRPVGSFPPSAFQWSASAGTLSASSGATTTLTLPAGFAGGPVDVTLALTDSRGCAAVRTERHDLVRAPVPALSAPLVARCQDAAGTRFDLDASGSAGSGALGFAWSANVPGAVFAPAGAARTTVTFPPAFSGVATVTLVVTDSTGCPAAATIDLRVEPLPVARLAVDPTGACVTGGVPPEVALDGTASTAASPGGIVSYRFTATGPATIVPTGPASARAVYPPGQTGTYQATLEVTDASGCVHAETRSFTLLDLPPPRVQLVARASDLCVAPGSTNDVVLDATGTDPGTWSFTTSAGATVLGSGPLFTLRIAPAAPSPVTATLTLRTASGCIASRSVSVAVRELPAAVAAANPASACEGQTFVLDGSGSTSRHPTDPTLAFRWTSADGALGSPAAARTDFTPPVLGSSRDALAALVVVDAGGCASAPVEVGVKVDASPLARFAATALPDGRSVAFSALATTGGTPPYTFTWDFGDGSPAATGATPTHAYAAAGTYTVTLTASGAGCAASVALPVTVGLSLAGSLAAGEGCAAGDLTLTVTINGGTPPLAFDWDFGDSTRASGTSPSVTHRYAAPGSYPVSVAVRDAAGRTGAFTAVAVVHPLPSIGVATAGPGLAGVPQDFEATATPGAAVAWTFSDGASASGARVRHAFLQAGPAWARAEATTAAGCRSADTVALTVADGTTSIAFTKSASPAETAPGGEVEYAIFVGNGHGVADAVTIEDQLPAGFEYRPGTLRRDGAAMGEPAGTAGSLLFPGFTLAPDSTSTITYRVRVRDEVAAGDHDNSATLRARDARGRTFYAGPRVATVRVVRDEPRPETGVDLRVVKHADADPEPPAPGGLVHYRLEYANVGTALATGVVLRDDWPSDRATLVENGDRGIVAGGRIEWPIGSVPPGSSGQLQYTLALDPDLAPGTPIHNVVVISSIEVDLKPADNRDESDLAVGGLPDLALTKTVATSPDPAVPGAVATYTLGWTNRGAPAFDVVVSDDYDESKLEIVGLPAGATDSGGVLRFELGRVASGATGVLTYQARLRDGAIEAVENRAEISTPLADRNPADNQARARFDVVTTAATLTLGGELAPARRCHQPQVEVALRSDRFDTAGAMAAAAAFLDAAGELEASPAASDPFLAPAALPALVDRLETFSTLNVESLLLDSGMGLGWAPADRARRAAAHAAAAGLAAAPDLPAPVSLPFDSAHPVFALQRGLDEPWCRHDQHRATGPRAAGETLRAIAAYAERALASADPERGFKARIVLDEAHEAIARLAAWREQGIVGHPPGPLPARLLLMAGPDGVVAPSVADPRSLPREQAALARGLLALASAARRHPAAAPAGLAERAVALATTVLADLGALAAGDPVRLAAGGALDAATVAAAAEALELASVLGVAAPAGLEAAVRASAGAVEGDARLLTRTHRIRAALALGERDRALAGFEQLEAGWLEPRLRIWSSDGSEAGVSYTPELLAGVVRSLSRLARDASPALRARAIERLTLTIEKVAVEAGLQTGLTSRTTDDGGVRLLLGSDGEVKVASLVADGPHALAPVLIDRVSFLPQGIHHRDLSLVAAARGVSEEGSAVSYLTGSPGDCRTAQVRLADRRFVAESGLFAIEAMEQAGRALEGHGRANHDALLAGFGAELRHAAHADRISLTMLGGAGLRLTLSGSEAESARAEEALRRHARTAGLEQEPVGFPLWLPFGAADPVFPAPVEWKTPYAQGWDASRHEPALAATAIGRALLADVRSAERGLASPSPYERWTALVRLEAAARTVALVAGAVAGPGPFAGIAPVVDAEGRLIDLGRIKGGRGLGGDAALVRGLLAYRGLVASAPLQALPEAARPATAGEAAGRALATLLPALVAGAAGGQGDPLELAEAVQALGEAGAAGLGEAGRLVAAARAAAAAAAASRGAEISPLARAALTLAARARAGVAGAELAEAYRAFRDGFFDRTWRVFRSGVAEPLDRDGVAGEAFLLTDLDVGAVLMALAEAMPALGASERTEAADLIYAAGGRMLFETGLERAHRLESLAGTTAIVATAPQISRAVRVTIADSPIQPGTVYPGDLVTATFAVANPTESSVADEVTVHTAVRAPLAYVPGSTRVNGQPWADPATGETLSFPLGRLGGGQTAEISFLLRVAGEARPGSYKIATRAAARSVPGPGGKPLETPPVLSTLGVDAFGAVAGRVWLDADGDGRPGTGEPGVAEVTLVLDDGTATVTDVEGRYRMPSLVPAGYTVQVLEGSLPGPMSTVGTGEARVRVRPNEAATADFGLSPAEAITGIVYRDENGNRRMDAGEQPVAGVVVETAAGQSSVSDRTGRYLIRGVASGAHVVRVARRQPWVKDAGGLLLRPMALPPPAVRAAASP